MQDQLTLCIGIFAPVGTNIRRTIIENDITLLIFEFLPKLLVAGSSGDIALEAGGTWNTLDWVQINADDG